MKRKRIIEIFAGPNGCGKSTLAELMLARRKKPDFINADIIAKGMKELLKAVTGFLNV